MIETGKYLEGYIQIILRRAEELNKLPVPEVTREAYLTYFETGDRLTFERQYFARREQLTVFGLAAALWKDAAYYNNSNNCQEAFVSRLLQVISTVLSENTWVLPAHGSTEHWDRNAVSIDLFAAETAGAVSEILYLIRDNPLVSGKYCNEYKNLCDEFSHKARERIFAPLLKKNPCDWWEKGSMNWTAVCSGNIGICCYYSGLMEMNILTASEAGEIFDRVTDSMICYLSAMAGDGACGEGVGYYKYGMENFLSFYEILAGMGKMDKIKEIGDFEKTALFLQSVYLGNGNSVNFSDCELKNKAKLGMISYLSSLYENVTVGSDFAGDGRLELDTEKTEVLGGSECHRWLGGYRDYSWVKKYGSYLRVSDNEGSYVYDKTMWYIKKWNGGSGFFIKGGNNAESHNHNDVGSFGYIADGEEILCDLGAGEYTRDYFGENRYNILCNSSRGHNVPIVLGRCQKSGKDAVAESFSVVEETVNISFGKAYGMEEHSVERTVSFSEKCGFTVRDKFETGENGTITECFITRIKPIPEANRVLLQGKKTAVAINFESGKPYVVEEIHREHSGDSHKVYIIKADYINNTTAYIIEINVQKL